MITINEALVLRKRADASKCDRTSVLLRQIAKADSTESVDIRISDCVSTKAMISVEAAFSTGTIAIGRSGKG